MSTKAGKTDRAGGTAYTAHRRLPDESQFAIIGISDKKASRDNTLMAGPDSVQYIVQGQRGDSSGPVSPLFTVNFGNLADGRRTANVSTAAMNAGTPSNNAAAWNVELPAPNGNGSRAMSRV